MDCEPLKGEGLTGPSSIGLNGGDVPKTLLAAQMEARCCRVARVGSPPSRTAMSFCSSALFATSSVIWLASTDTNIQYEDAVLLSCSTHKLGA
jgi:hypothetical protein